MISESKVEDMLNRNKVKQLNVADFLLCMYALSDDQDRLAKYEEYYDDTLRHGMEYTYVDLSDDDVKEILKGAKQLVKDYPLVENANVSKMYKEYVNNGH